MSIKEESKKALKELREQKQRKFDQSVELIINLHKIDIKKTPVNLFVNIPNKVKDKKIAAFLEYKLDNIDTIPESEFKKYNDKKEIKKLVNQYDFFIAQAKVMPKVATTFGKVLGPAGKMPSPQLGIIQSPDEKAVEEIKEKINKNIKLKLKEPSIKVCIGKQSIEDEKIIENIDSFYKAVLNELPKGKDNIKDVKLKFTMTKPIKLNVK